MEKPGHVAIGPKKTSVLICAKVHRYVSKNIHAIRMNISRLGIIKTKTRHIY